MYFFHVLNTFNNIRKGKYACFMNMFIQHFKSCRKIKRLKKYPLTLNGIKTWWCLLLARAGGGLSASAMCLACKCRQYVQITFVPSTEPSGSVLKGNLTFISPFSIYAHFHFSVQRVGGKRPPCFFFFWFPFLAFWIKTTGAIDGRKSYNAHFFFFYTKR